MNVLILVSFNIGTWHGLTKSHSSHILRKWLAQVFAQSSLHMQCWRWFFANMISFNHTLMNYEWKLIFVADALFPILWSSFRTFDWDIYCLFTWKFRWINRLNHYSFITICTNPNFDFIFVLFFSMIVFMHQRWILNGMKCQWGNNICTSFSSFVVKTPHFWLLVDFCHWIWTHVLRFVPSKLVISQKNIVRCIFVADFFENLQHFHVDPFNSLNKW